MGQAVEHQPAPKEHLLVVITKSSNGSKHPLSGCHAACIFHSKAAMFRRKPVPRCYGITMSFCAKPPVHKRVCAVAAKDRRSVSNVLAVMVEDGLAACEKKLGIT
jgi:hypothetical protein